MSCGPTATMVHRYPMAHAFVQAEKCPFLYARATGNSEGLRRAAIRILKECFVEKFQKIGGVAAILEAACYIIGFCVFIFFLDPPSYLEPVKSVEFLIDNEALMLSAMTIIYIFAAIVLLILVLALHERLKAAMPMMMTTATAWGVIWVGIVVASGMIFITGSQTVIALYAVDPERAGTIWLAVGVIQDALGGGIELVGGIWILLISLIALRAGAFPKLLNYLGLILGVAGILSVVPLFIDLVAVFGLGQIIWFIWIGMIMITKHHS